MKVRKNLRYHDQLTTGCLLLRLRCMLGAPIHPCKIVCFCFPTRLCHCAVMTVQMIYRKIPKISPEAYIFQRPFLRGLFLEGLVFGGAYLRRKICVSKSIGLALQLERNLPFLLCFTLYLRAISKYKPPGRLIFGGAIKRRVFCVTSLGGLYLDGLIHGGAYFRNFTHRNFQGVIITPKME